MQMAVQFVEAGHLCFTPHIFNLAFRMNFPVEAT